MAIDMTTVKQIMHNNKEVVKIEDGLGKVLWQKQAQPEWHTIFETDNSYWGTWILKLSGSTWTLGSVPANISDKATKLRITYKPYVSTAGTDANYIKITLNTTYTGQNPPDGDGITVYPNSDTKRTDTFDYTQGNQIMHVIYSLDQVRSTDDWNYSWSVKANARWYKNGLASGYVGRSWRDGREAYIAIYKIEEYY